MSTNKSRLWLLIVCVSDDIVVMSQSINKKFRAPTPSCFVYKQPYYLLGAVSQ
jgi:hypothetical protein